MTLCIFLLTLFCIFVRPFGLRIWIYTSIGAALCLVLSGVDSKDLETIFSLTWDSSLTLIALIILSYSLEELGFFRTLVAVLFAQERSISTFRLFGILTLFCAGVSMVFSNDGAILVMTPLLFSLFANIAVPQDKESSSLQDNTESPLPTQSTQDFAQSNNARKAPVKSAIGARDTESNPIESSIDSPAYSTFMHTPIAPVFFAFVFAIAFVCDATSNALVISNLTNIITAHYFALPFLEFFLTMLMPNVCVLAGVLLVFYLTFRRTLPPTLYIRRPTQMRMETWLFAFCIIVLLAFVGAFFALERYGLPLCVPSLIVAVLFALIALAKSSRHTFKVLRNAPYGVLIFSFGLYIIVFALHREGLSNPLADMYAFFSDMGMRDGAVWAYVREYHLGLFGVGFISMLGANLCNNLPMTLFGNLAIDTLSDSALIIYAHLLACNIGAKLTPIGSLATLLWIGLCAQRGYHIGFWQYMRYSLIFTPLVLVCAIGGLLMGAFVMK